MKKSIKGITVQIGGETSGLTAALKKADDALRNTQSELKKVQQMLKFDPNNTVLLEQQQTLLNQAIKETADKLKVLQDAYEDVKKANESGAITDEQLRECGTSPDLLRLSVGIEYVGDIIDDIKQALNNL